MAELPRDAGHLQLPARVARRRARRGAGLPRGFLFERLPSDWKKLAAELGRAAIHPNRALTREEVAAVKAAGYPMLVWTVNEPARARELVAWGVDSIITDSPAAILAALQ